MFRTRIQKTIHRPIDPDEAKSLLNFNYDSMTVVSWCEKNLKGKWELVDQGYWIDINPEFEMTFEFELEEDMKAFNEEWLEED